MGSWNKTCGLTRLHIMAGTEVYVIPLERSKGDVDDRCYTTSFWKPLLLPFIAEYDDYGGGQDCRGAALKPVMSGIASELMEMPLGENQYHDVEVKREDFDETKFFEAVLEHRLFLADFMPDARVRHTQLDYVMLRRDVVDDMLANVKIVEYAGQGKGTTGYGKSYVNITYKELLGVLPEVLAALKRTLSLASGLQHFLVSAGRLESLVDMKDEDIVIKRAARLMSIGEDYRYSRLVRPVEHLANLVETGQDQEAMEFMEAMLLGGMIEYFMDGVRGVWAPACHEGSQANDESGYRLVMAAMDRALLAERAEWGHDDDEDEEEDTTECESTDNPVV